MNAPRARRIRVSGGLAFATVALLGVIALGAIAGDSQAKSPAGFLGVSTQELDEELRDSYGYRGPGGVLVQSVERDGAAAKAGVRRGDVIVRYAGTTVSTPEELGRLVRSDAPGKRVPLSLWRDGREVALQVTLGSREAADDSGPRERTYAYRDHGDDDDELFEWHEMPPMRGMGRSFDLLLDRPRLGVEIQDLNTDLGSYFQVPDGHGVLVTRVIDDSPASRAGMKAGDVILEVGGKRVDDAEALHRELREVETGPVRLTVQRKGARQTLTAELEERRSPRAMAMRVPRSGRMRMERAPGVGQDQKMRELERQLEDLQRQMEDLRRDADR